MQDEDRGTEDQVHGGRRRRTGDAPLGKVRSLRLFYDVTNVFQVGLRLSVLLLFLSCGLPTDDPRLIACRPYLYPMTVQK